MSRERPEPEPEQEPVSEGGRAFFEIRIESEEDAREALARARIQIDLERSAGLRILKALREQPEALGTRDIWIRVDEQMMHLEARLMAVVNHAKEMLGLPIEDLDREEEARERVFKEAYEIGGLPREVVAQWIEDRIKRNKIIQEGLRNAGSEG